MGGTRFGGIKTAQTIKANDPDFYKRIGAKGGSVRTPKGFAVMDRAQLSAVSRKGGLKRRKKVAA